MHMMMPQGIIMASSHRRTSIDGRMMRGLLAAYGYNRGHGSLACSDAEAMAWTTNKEKV